MMEMETPSKESAFETIDDVLEYLNPYGRFQWIINILLSVVYSAALLQVILPYFLSIEPAWRCLKNSTTCDYNDTIAVTEKDRCKLPRDGWEYTEPIEFSIVSQFDLICDRAWISHMMASCLYIGWPVGALFVGRVADRYGRKIVVIPTVALIFTVAVIPAFVSTIPMLIASRFIIGLLINGVAPISLVLMGEFVDTKHRPVAMVIMYCAHTFAYIILCVQAYFVRRWKHLLIASVIPYTFVLGFYKFLPESIHWLHLRGLKERIDRVFERISYWNKVPLPDNNLSKYLAPPKQNYNDQGLKEIFVTRVLLSRTLNLSYGWFTVVMIYFGLSLGADDLGGSIYVNFVLISSIEIPANIFVMYASKNFGRRPTVCGSMILSGVTCYTLFFIPISGKGAVLRKVLGVTAKACVTIAYNTLYIWSFEIYPTSNRARAISFLTVIGRCGGAAAPWVVKGLKLLNEELSFAIMGGSGIICALLLLILPETKHLAIKEYGRVDAASVSERGNKTGDEKEKLLPS